MKTARPIAVIAAVVVLAGATTVAFSATTATEPVRLCAHSSNGSISLPADDGGCAKNSTAFYVASDADVQALATRLDATEEDQAADDSEIEALQTQVADLSEADARQDSDIALLRQQNADLTDRIESLEPNGFTISAKDVTVEGYNPRFTIKVVGSGLKPNTPVTLHYWQYNYYSQIWEAAKVPMGSADDEGSFQYERSPYDAFYCEDFDFYATGTGSDGEHVTSAVIPKGPPCFEGPR